MLKIAVCDDDLFFLSNVHDAVKKILELNRVEHSITTFQTARLLLSAGFFDIVFLDVELDGINGIETARMLREREREREMKRPTRIVFLSSHKKYVFSAFDVSASHYLLKPLDVQKLEQVLMKIESEITAEAQCCYTVKCGTQVYRVPFAQIKYAEIFGRSITLHTKQEVLTFNGRLEELEKAFPKHFFRCHKSYLVNLAAVIKYDKESALLQDGEAVPIARRKFTEFAKAFLTFLQEAGE